MRFALETYRAIRKEVGRDFPVGIKLNSADFQRGGFTQEESMQVVRRLSAEGMDLIEISGGTYESPEMTGVTRKASTRTREAYFLEYCEEVRKNAGAPLMLTGGFRSAQGMNDALSSGACDVVGLARSLAIAPGFAGDLLSARDAVSEVRPLTTGWRALDRLFPLEITWYTQQLHRMGAGKNPDKNLSVKGSVVGTLFSLGRQSLRRVRAK
jgi:2,4-dienoyl-CoA reductase-like NADH-dependent reductase (Old Yellow Enzyme family)